jgi:hypothetical protein
MDPNHLALGRQFVTWLPVCWNLVRSCDRQRKGKAQAGGSWAAPALRIFCTGPLSPFLPVSALSPSSGTWGSAAKWKRGVSGPKPASSQPPSLYLSKPRACLIMINCHIDNQIQFQKVGNDIPRTPGKIQGTPLFTGRKGRSIPQPCNLFLF